MNAVIAGTAVLVALVLTELALRRFSPQPLGVTLHDPYGLAMHWPGLVQYLPQYHETLSFNSAGMRDREHPVEKPEGTFRILLLGDSFIEAAQVAFEESLPSLLERGLRQRTARQVEVVSAGVAGWSTDQQLRYLTTYGMKWHPDLVVVAMTLHNDIEENLQEQWHTIRNGVLVTKPVTRSSFLSYQIVRIKAWAAARLQLYQLWRRVRHGAVMRQAGVRLAEHTVELFREPAPEPIVRGWALTGLLLGQVRSVVEGGGGKLAVVLLPLRFQLTDSLFSRFLANGGLHPPPVLDTPQREATRLASGLGIPVIDLLPTFRQWVADGGASPYLEWDGHWNQIGHRLAAERVVSGLLERGLLRN